MMSFSESRFDLQSSAVEDDRFGKLTLVEIMIPLLEELLFANGWGAIATGPQSKKSQQESQCEQPRLLTRHLASKNGESQDTLLSSLSSLQFAARIQSNQYNLNDDLRY